MKTETPRVFEFNMGSWKPIEFPFDVSDEESHWLSVVSNGGYTYNQSLGTDLDDPTDCALKIYEKTSGDSLYPFFCEVEMVYDYPLAVFFLDYPSLFMFVTSVSSFALLKMHSDITEKLEGILKEQGHYSSSRRSRRK